jgi:hypothetical protein
MKISDTTKSIEITTLAVHDLTEDRISQILALFDAAYADANHSYLLASFEVMDWIALAMHGSVLAGFAIGDAKIVDLPRMHGLQPVATYGIGCVDENFRRMGLFTRLEEAVVQASGKLPVNGRYLNCGRTAHPATYNFFANIGMGSIPEPDCPLSPWHLEMVERVAALYCAKVHPGTCVIIGKGMPIGYPRLKVMATDTELRMFEKVNRDRGEALLTMSWTPEAPSGW